MSTRHIQEHLRSRPTLEGAGVHLRRAFGYPQVPLFDPFLMLDEFHSGNPEDYLPGFPWHPHRGMETITYVLEGRIEHRDSIGNAGEIGPGDVQWMTAGSGIIHQEMPQPVPDGVLWGCQLWANLPAAHKMMPPRYREVKAAEIPALTLTGGVTVKVISGTVAGTQGPVRDIVTDPEFLDVTIPAGASVTHAVKPGYTVFAYVIDGAGHFDNGGDLFDTGSVILYEPDGDSITVTATAQPVHFFLCAGKPLGEPIAWQGPIVMNTQEELRTAFQEFHNGTFVK